MKTILLTILICILSVQISQAQWQPDVRLTNDSANSTTSWNNAWCIASSGNDVHVVWYDYRHGNSEIYYKRSTDGGTSWGSDTRLTNAGGESRDPSVSVSGSAVHVVWHDYRDGSGYGEIYYKHSIDGGASWGADIRLTMDPASSYFPSVAASGSNVHIIWADDRNSYSYGDIYYTRSTDGGASWGGGGRLTYDSIFNAGPPSVSVSGSSVHVSWYEYRDGNYDVYYKSSLDGGASWGADSRFTNNSADSQRPSLSTSGSIVHIVWMESYEIYYKRSTDGGGSWSVDTRLSNSLSGTTNPSVTVSGSAVHVVWEDYRYGNEIFYRHSSDGGVTWGTESRLTNAIAGSAAPSVSVSGSTVHVVWMDGRDGNSEIYYKRNPNGNVTNIENIGSELPRQFKLEQNYPNPFNPSTTIHFSVPSSEFVTLKVYDVLGNEVATLVNEEKTAGNYEVDFNASKLSSGVYFYKLQAGSFVETKKMILLR